MLAVAVVLAVVLAVAVAVVLAVVLAVAVAITLAVVFAVAGTFRGCCFCFLFLFAAFVAFLAVAISQLLNAGTLPRFVATAVLQLLLNARTAARPSHKLRGRTGQTFVGHSKSTARNTSRARWSSTWWSRWWLVGLVGWVGLVELVGWVSGRWHWFGVLECLEFFPVSIVTIITIATIAATVVHGR